MKTRTIFRAYVFAGEEYRSGMRTGRRRRRMRQIGVFADELERRMDERDDLKTQNARILCNLQIAWQNNTNLARKLYAPEEDSK